MKLARSNALLISLFCQITLAAVVHSQELGTFDPTAPSAAIIDQEEAIRGLDRLKQLQTELDRVTGENRRLSQELLRKDAEIAAVRNEVRQNQALREAVPPFRLVGLVQAEAFSIAVIDAGGKAYRVRSNQEFLLELSDGGKVRVVCVIDSPDSVELTIPDLSLTETVFFHPTVK